MPPAQGAPISGARLVAARPSEPLGVLLPILQRVPWALGIRVVEVPDGVLVIIVRILCSDGTGNGTLSATAHKLTCVHKQNHTRNV